MWNQTSLDVLEIPVQATNPFAFWARPRWRIIQHLGLAIPTLRKKRNKSFNGKQIKVVYLDQQSSDRRLVKEDHDFVLELLESLESQSRGRFGQKLAATVVDVAETSPESQVRSVLDADVSRFRTAL